MSNKLYLKLNLKLDSSIYHYDLTWLNSWILFNWRSRVDLGRGVSTSRPRPILTRTIQVPLTPVPLKMFKMQWEVRKVYLNPSSKSQQCLTRTMKSTFIGLTGCTHSIALCALSLLYLQYQFSFASNREWVVPGRGIYIKGRVLVALQCMKSGEWEKKQLPSSPSWQRTLLQGES